MHLRIVTLAILVLAAAALAQNPITADSPFQIGYAANLNQGESWIGIINTGANGAPLQGPAAAPVGNICVNLYVFSPDQQLISCCSCLVPPDGAINLGVNQNLLANPVQPFSGTAVTVKLLTTLAGTGGAGTSCTNSAASATYTNIVSGPVALGTTLHEQPANGGGTTYVTTARPFTPATLSAGELASLTGQCNSVVGQGGLGICVCPAAKTSSSMTANPGTTPQTAAGGATFAQALAVTVTDAGNSPVPNLPVTFTAPSSGRSGTFANGTNTTQATTDANGVATASAFTANGLTGPYGVAASASGLIPVYFELTNLPAAPSPAISGPASLPLGTANAVYPLTTVTATGGSGGYSFQATGLPPGLTLSSGGVLSGTPATSIGSPFTVQVTVTDSASKTGNKSYQLTLNPALAISGPASLPVGVMNVLYPATTVTATGGSGGFSFAAMGLPAGLSLSTGGVLSGTPTTSSATPYTVQITVTDSSSNTANTSYQLTVNPPLAITGPAGASLPEGTITVSYPDTAVTATGGSGGYNFAATGLPAGLSLSAGGVVTGTPASNTAGPYTVQVTVTDSSSSTANRSYQLIIDTKLTITGPASLPAGTLHSPYPATTVTAAAGTGGYNFTATGLPMGMAMSAQGVILGTPGTNSGSPYSIQVTVTDSSLATATRTYQLTISGPMTITGPAALPAGIVNAAYPATTVTATGGSGGYTFTATGLPAGLSLSTSGVLMGTPATNSGSPFTVQVTVTDSSSSTANSSYQLTIYPMLQITGPASLSSGAVGASYPATLVTAAGGSGGYSFAAVGLPAGLSLSASGLLTGTPATNSGSPFTVLVTVTDSSSNTANQSFPLTVNASGTLAITGPASLPPGTAGSAYPSTTVTAAGGSGAYSFTAVGLPAGLSLSAGGVLTGTPATNSGSPFTVQVTVTDSSSNTANKSYQLVINPNGTLAITGPAALPVGTLHSPYPTTAVTASGGAGNYNFTATGLPAGMAMSAQGVILGTPGTNSGSPYSVQVTVTDSSLATATRTYQLTISGPVTITGPAALPAGVVNAAYPATTVTATGGSGGYIFTATGLPAGLSLSTSGVLTGTPATNGGSPFTVQVTVTDSSSNTANNSYQLTILPMLQIAAPASLPAGTVSTSYPATLVTATGGSGGYSFTATGLPAGLTLSTNGIITGTPTTNSGSPFTVQVTVTDGSSDTAGKSYLLAISPGGVLAIAGPASLPAGTVGSAYSPTTVTATGGTGVYSFTATGLPAGLSLSTLGVITGTPTTNSGSPFTVQVTVTDSSSNTANKSYSLSISPSSPLAITGPAALAGGTAGSPYPTTTVIATGGSGGYTFTSTGLPAGLSLSTSGVITGTPSTNIGSPFTVQVTVTDSSLNTANTSYQLNITAALAISAPATLPAGALFTPYPATTVTATGGAGGYSFTATGLPTGLGISGQGIILGTPTTNSASPYTVQVTVTDSSFATATRGYQLAINVPVTITGPATLPVGLVGSAYPPTTVTATGGSGGYTFAAAGLPAGLSLSTSGVLTGTPSSASGSTPFTVVVTATDSSSNTGSTSYQLTILPALQIAGPASLSVGTAGLTYPATLVTATGGSGGYSFTATGLPGGLSLSTNGIITGTPATSSGSPFTVLVTVTDSSSNIAGKSYTLVIIPNGTLAITGPAALPAGTLGSLYPTTTMTAAGGTGGYNFTATGLPLGLAMSAQGAILGAPTINSGSPYSVQVTVTDSSLATATRNYQLTINGPVTITGPAALPAGIVNAAYAATTVTAAGGSGGYSFTAAGLPAGLSLSASGVLTGTPATNSGSPFTVQVTVTDSSLNTATTIYHLTIYPMLQITGPASLPSGTVGTSYPVTLVTAVGGTGVYSFAATGLPSGLSLSASGVLMGTPTTNNGSPFTVQVTVTDSVSNTANKSFSLTINASGTLTITGPVSLPVGMAGAAYLPTTVTAAGGSGGYSFTAIGLPAGLSLSTSGVITGTPATNSGSPFTVQVTVTDSSSNSANKSYQLVINPSGTLVITGPSVLPVGTLHSPYPTTTITAAGGAGGYNFTATGLPAGMAISAQGIVLGTPLSDSGSPYNVQVTVTDSNLSTAIRTYQLTIIGPVTITGPAALPVGVVGSVYPPTTVTATGGSGGYSFTAAGLPAGLSLSTSGVLTGTPTSAGGNLFTVQVTVTDTSSNTATDSYQLTIYAMLQVVGPASLPAGTVSLSYPATLVTATGGSGGYSFTATGLPAGLSLSVSGVLTGMPATNSGSPFTVQVTVTDSNSNTANKSYQLVVNPSMPLMITGPAVLPSGTVGSEYPSTTVTAIGGAGVYSFTATGLPAGLSISSAGTITGTPTTNTGSPFSVQVTVTDSSSNTANANYLLAINASGTLAITGPASLSVGTVGSSYPATLITAAGGSGGYTFSAAGLPAGLTLSTNGILKGTPATNSGSPFTVLVMVTDSSSNTASASYSLVIIPSGTLAITGPAALPAGTLGSPYPMTTVTAAGGVGGYNFTATGLPTGMAISAQGLILGTPTTNSGSPYTVQVTVADSSLATASFTYQLTIN